MLGSRHLQAVRREPARSRLRLPGRSRDPGEALPARAASSTPHQSRGPHGQRPASLDPAGPCRRPLPFGDVAQKHRQQGRPLSHTSVLCGTTQPPRVTAPVPNRYSVTRGALTASHTKLKSAVASAGPSSVSVQGTRRARGPAAGRTAEAGGGGGAVCTGTQNQGDLDDTALLLPGPGAHRSLQASARLTRQSATRPALWETHG